MKPCSEAALRVRCTNGIVVEVSFRLDFKLICNHLAQTQEVKIHPAHTDRRSQTNRERTNNQQKYSRVENSIKYNGDQVKSLSPLRQAAERYDQIPFPGDETSSPQHFVNSDLFLSGSQNILCEMKLLFNATLPAARREERPAQHVVGLRGRCLQAPDIRRGKSAEKHERLVFLTQPSLI